MIIMVNYPVIISQHHALSLLPFVGEKGGGRYGKVINEVKEKEVEKRARERKKIKIKLSLCKCGKRACEPHYFLSLLIYLFGWGSFFFFF